MGFKWTPGLGPSKRSLAVMRANSLKPDYPMGEGWFQAENRLMYTELEGDIGTISTHRIQEILGDMANGVSSFGCREEWKMWFSYILPRIIPRCDERFVSWLLEVVCTAFLQIDLGVKNGAEKDTYHEHVLSTLGQTLMASNRWQEGNIVLGKVLHPSNKNPAKIWGWTNVSGDLAASLIVCLRLIKNRDIQEWVDSIFAIKCPYWRAQLLTWYVGARPLLSGEIHFPSQFDEWTSKIDWSWSHVIKGNQGGIVIADSLFPEGNINCFREAFETNLRRADLAAWKGEILAIEALRTEVGALLSGFKIS